MKRKDQHSSRDATEAEVGRMTARKEEAAIDCENANGERGTI